MIISKTPFRISFAGGGTDIESYYKNGYGAVTSITVNKYIYIIVNRNFDDKLKLSYSKTEVINNIDEIQHPIIKAALKIVDIESGIEITSISDIPSRTGLGSSSSFTVGLLNCLYQFKGKNVSAKFLAEKACEIEIKHLNKPIGKQDQYAAAYGGCNYIRFNKDESVNVKPIKLSIRQRKAIEDNFLLFYTGIQRSADNILSEQIKNTEKKIDILDKMKEQALMVKNILEKNDDTVKVGSILDEGWKLKKKLCNCISNQYLNSCYKKAKRAGAVSGKILGAGGGGFLLLYCEKKYRNKVRNALRDLKKVEFDYFDEGSQIILKG